MTYRSLTPLVLLLLLTGCRDRSLDAERGSSVITILGATVINPDDGTTLNDAVLVVDEKQIRQVGPRSTTPVPKGGTTVDGTGKYVIPGLVDTHSHYFGAKDAVFQAFREQLKWGVTTARSTGVDTGEIFRAFAVAREEGVAMPQLYTAGLGFTAPGGHPVDQTMLNRPETPDQARELVRDLAARKVQFVKIWVESKGGAVPKIRREIQEALVDEAQKTGLRVVAHIFDEEDLRFLAERGVKDFLHTVRNSEPERQLMQYARANALCFSPTLSIIAADRSQELERAQRFVKAAADAGVCLAVGSDSGTPTVPMGEGTHREIGLMAKAGMTAPELLKAATTNGAQLLAKDESQVGTLEVGAAADLILLNANPLESHENLKKIAQVMRAGVWVKETNRNPIGERAVPARDQAH